MLCDTVTDPSHQLHSRFIPAQHLPESGGDSCEGSFFGANPCHERQMIQETPDMASQAGAQRNPASFPHLPAASVPHLRLFTFLDRTLLHHTPCKGCTSAEKFVRANVRDGAPSSQGILICMLIALSIY